MTKTIKSKIQEFTEELIKIASFEWKEESLSRILNVALQKIPDWFTIERFEKNKSKSALVYIWKERPQKFKILFNCHLDIIPWKDFQYVPKIDGDRLYWAWANDMKGNLAAAMFAFIECATQVNYPIALQLVTDEEIGGFLGTKFQVEMWVRADLIIATEPTNFDIVTRAKGVLWCKVHTAWKTAHGAYPWRWENAIIKNLNYIETLNKIIPNPESEEWVSTLNIAMINTDNVAYNKIPDHCTLSLDIRFIPGDDLRILDVIMKSLPDGFTLEILEHEPSVFTEEDNPLVTSLFQSISRFTNYVPRLYWANGTSDARHFSLVGGKWLEFGAIWWWIWEDAEWVSISSLENYYYILCDFLINQSE